jgi:hypothetical protein
MRNQIGMIAPFETIRAITLPNEGVVRAAVSQTRDDLVEDLYTCWGGTVKRVGTAAEDRRAIADLCAIVAILAESYRQAALITTNDTWRQVAEARHALFERTNHILMVL